MQTILPVIVLAAFGVFSVEVVMTHGYFGFITLAMREPWALQMLLDLCISIFIACRWLRRDAKALGLNPWPYIIAAIPVGSLSLLAYMIRRQRVTSRT